MDSIPTLQGQPGEGGLTSIHATTGRTIAIIGKRVPTTPEQDAAEMRRMWTPLPVRRSRSSKG